MRSHKQAVHGEKVFKCPRTGCQFSSSWKTSLAQHLKGIHGTAGSIACDHTGCTFRTAWLSSIAQHKQQVHCNERPFACDHTGCSFRAKTKSNLYSHNKKVHLKIRDERCHVCEKEFHDKCGLRSHMTTHEGDGHEMAACKDCSLNLRIRSSVTKEPVAFKMFQCDHQGCDFKSWWKRSLSSHRKHVHGEQRTFSCYYTGCAYRSKTKGDLSIHQRQLHLKIRTKCCHMCDKRFFAKRNLRAHMISHHQTKDHDIDECEDCLCYLKQHHKMSQAKKASWKRKAGKNVTKSNPANKSDTVCYKKKSGRKKGVSFSSYNKEQMESAKTNRLNEDLIDIHMDMKLLSSL